MRTARLTCLLARAQQLLTGESLERVPFVVLGNKIDLPGAASEEELRTTLGLTDTYGKEVRRRALDALVPAPSPADLQPGCRPRASGTPACDRSRCSCAAWFARWDTQTVRVPAFAPHAGSLR